MGPTMITNTLSRQTIASNGERYNRKPLRVHLNGFITDLRRNFVPRSSSAASIAPLGCMRNILQIIQPF